jgi:hypothetical protein
MVHGREENMQQLSLHDLRWGSWAMLAPWFSTAKLLVDGAGGASGEVPAIAAEEEVKEEDEEEEEDDDDDDDDDDVFMVGGRKMGGGALKAKDAKKKKKKKTKKTTTTEKRATKKKGRSKGSSAAGAASAEAAAAAGSVASRPWDYFINLSGDAFPVLSPDALRRRLAELTHPDSGEPLNFVTSSGGVTGLRPTAWGEFDRNWHKRKAFPFPIVEGTDASAFFGSQWMVVSHAFVAYVIREVAVEGSFVQKLANWFEHGTLEIDTGREMRRVKPHIPDELFFPTVLMNSKPFNATSVPDYRILGGGGGDSLAVGDGTQQQKQPRPMNAMHFIRMDEHYPWNNFAQRYEAPNEHTPSRRAWGPYYLGTYDLKDIKDSGALFIRKISPLVDENIFRLLPVDDHADIPDISWPGKSKCGRADEPLLMTIAFWCA